MSVARDLYDVRIDQLISAVEQLRQGHNGIDVPASPLDLVGRLGQSLQALARSLELRSAEIEQLNRITSRINSGLLLDDILDGVYHDFRELIPYNRIGFALLEDDGRIVRARWTYTDQPDVRLQRGYAARLAGSSLEVIMQTGQPRIINDLPAYLAHKPASDSTRLVVEEGMRSSLTCPLVANGVPVGFIFFSSVEPHAYADVHVALFQRIAEQLSVMVERGRLVSALADQKAVLEQQNEELRRLHDQQNIFLGMAAHDLRNPIGAIQMLAAILNTPEAPVSEDRRKQFIQRIYGQAANMLALLDDILDVSQIESGTFTLAPVPLDLGAALDEAVQHHDVLARSKGTSVRLHAVPPALVRADPLRLRQVLDNLISNAVKFSPPGSVVTVGARPHDRMWRVAVRDQGPGITRDDQEKLFTAFSRLSARPTGGERSTGLGLAITRQVVLAHGGQIGVKSTPGQGATFWFTLPASLPAHATG